jgi:secondary thiamine-phosphate synthase enzyme
MKKISVKTLEKTSFTNITSEIAKIVTDSAMKDGVVTVFVPHTTAGVTINENADPDVVFDMEQALEQAVPWDAGYRHGEGNAAAHVKASMMGSSLQVIVADGKMQLGTWQGVFFCEFDGPRERSVYVT